MKDADELRPWYVSVLWELREILRDEAGFVDANVDALDYAIAVLSAATATVERAPICDGCTTPGPCGFAEHCFGNYEPTTPTQAAPEPEQDGYSLRMPEVKLVNEYKSISPSEWEALTAATGENVVVESNPSGLRQNWVREHLEGIFPSDDKDGHHD